MADAATILVVDDDPVVRQSIRELLHGCGFIVREAGCCETGLAAFRRHHPDVVLIEHRLPDGDGVNVIGQMRATDPDVPCIVLSGHGSIDLAVQALKEGAENFVTKPIKSGLLETLIPRLLQQQASRKRTIVQDVREARADLDPFLGTSPAIRRLAEDAHRMVGADGPLLLLGETGSGKGVLARWCHRNGPRREEAFVDLNCASLSREFLESELFGHERGAFTGAVTTKPGLLEIAHRGILFLDEIGDMDLAIQPKLLKVLEDKRFRRLGEVREREVSVRLIAATHHDLGELVAAQRFRRDLYFRIGTLPLSVPPLRERAEDIPVLVEDLLARIGRELGRPGMSVSGAALTSLVRYAWPGNLRELRNLLERAVLLTDGTTICVRELRLHARGELASRSTASSAAEDLTLAELERRHIERVYEAEGHNVHRAAIRLGIPRSSLYQKLARLGLLRKAREAG
ncbi:MAG TPA: sigma-54 dependent transcriptional regulator [Kofleriaceae bacterium]|nr:sigma-54 dependent transcriptional regulator [Kofleriaceae bacterium]